MSTRDELLKLCERVLSESDKPCLDDTAKQDQEYELEMAIAAPVLARALKELLTAGQAAPPMPPEVEEIARQIIGFTPELWKHALENTKRRREGCAELPADDVEAALMKADRVVALIGGTAGQAAPVLTPAEQASLDFARTVTTEAPKMMLNPATSRELVAIIDRLLTSAPSPVPPTLAEAENTLNYWHGLATSYLARAEKAERALAEAQPKAVGLTRDAIKTIVENECDNFGVTDQGNREKFVRCVLFEIDRLQASPSGSTRTPGTIEICEVPSCATAHFREGCYKSGDARAVGCPHAPASPQGEST